MLDKKIVDMDSFDLAISNMARTLDGKGLENAVQAAGNVILKEVESRAPVRTGALKASIRNLGYRKTGQARSVISVSNSKKYGLRHYAVFLEFGTSNMASKPFMRPAFDVAEPQALEAFTRALNTELERV